jgi:hypothetical protein
MNRRVSLATTGRGPAANADDDGRPTPLLNACGARVILGGELSNTLPVTPVVPTANTLFAPRGAVLAKKDGPLFVCDTGHHRLMIWRQQPTCDQASADLVIGQPDFAFEGRNALKEPGPATLNVPTGVAVENGILAVADAWNHRVLIWHCIPTRCNQPADVVVGQRDSTSTEANGGANAPDASTLNWCYGVAIHDHRLIVADTGNRRVLVWDAVPERHGAPADLVLGQRDFGVRDDDGGGQDPASGMRWPHGVALADGRLFVADAGLSRIMCWSAFPRRNGQACDFVLGQSNFGGRNHNAGAYHPTAGTLNMPYGLCATGDQLILADTANSRLLGFDFASLATGKPANRISGQHTFNDKGDNRWGAPQRDSLCWPYGIAACGTTLVIADSGNNRVLLWEAA